MKTIILFILLVSVDFAQSNLLLLFSGGYKNTETTLYTAGQTITGTQATRVDNFISMLKDSFSVASLSEIADVIYLSANESSALGLRNLVSRNYDGTIGAETVTFTQWQGFLGDGVGGYINTNYTPSTNGVAYKLDDASYGVYVRTVRLASSSKVVMGAVNNDGSTYSMIQLERSTGLSRQYINATGLSGGTVANTSGFSLVVRTGSTTTNFYKNGIAIAPDTDVSTALPNVTFTVLAQHLGATLLTYDDVEISFVFIGKGFDATGARKLKNCVEYYMDQLGTGVLP